jgi:hypothetical protein
VGGKFGLELLQATLGLLGQLKELLKVRHDRYAPAD